MDQAPSTRSQIKHDLFTREYRLGDLLTLAWQLFSENFKTILIVTLIVYVPISLVSAALPVSPSDSASPSSIWTATATANLLVSMLLILLVGVLAPLAIAVAIRKQLDGQIIDYRAVLKSTVSKWPAALFTSILMGICVLGLTFLFVVPGIIFAIYWSFTIYIIILDNKSGMEAMKYSKSVVKGRWWKVLGYLIVFSIISGMVSSIINIPLAKFTDFYLINFISALLANIVFSYVSVASIILFLNLEANKITETKDATLPSPQK